MKSFFPVFFLFCLFSALAHADTLEDEFTKHHNSHGPPRFFTATLENDSLGSGADRNYTSGIRLSYFDAGETPPLLAKAVDAVLPVFTVNATTAVTYSLGQNFYTPRDLLRRAPDPADRPYAAFLYTSLGLSTIEDNHMDRVELTAGIVGPMALGQETQKFVHGLLNERDPQGWGAQLRNEPGLILSWERLWPEVLTAEMGEVHFRATPYGGITLGNIYTYGNVGLLLQLVPKAHKWQGMPLRVRPSIPGNGYFAVPDDTFSWNIFAGLEGRAVARNIFLDGNSFQPSAYVEKKNAVGDASLGLALTYGPAQISYTLNWRSEEFLGQDKPDLFGAIALGYRF